MIDWQDDDGDDENGGWRMMEEHAPPTTTHLMACMMDYNLFWWERMKGKEVKMGWEGWKSKDKEVKKEEMWENKVLESDERWNNFFLSSLFLICSFVRFVHSSLVLPFQMVSWLTCTSWTERIASLTELTHTHRSSRTQTQTPPCTWLHLCHLPPAVWFLISIISYQDRI